MAGAAGLADERAGGCVRCVYGWSSERSSNRGRSRRRQPPWDGPTVGGGSRYVSSVISLVSCGVERRGGEDVGIDVRQRATGARLLAIATQPAPIVTRRPTPEAPGRAHDHAPRRGQRRNASDRGATVRSTRGTIVSGSRRSTGLGRVATGTPGSGHIGSGYVGRSDEPHGDDPLGRSARVAPLTRRARRRCGEKRTTGDLKDVSGRESPRPQTGPAQLEPGRQAEEIADARWNIREERRGECVGTRRALLEQIVQDLPTPPAAPEPSPRG